MRPALWQVTELETLFEGLRSDVDTLFMQAPSVDQGALCARCEEMHQHINEQACSHSPCAHSVACSSSFSAHARPAMCSAGRHYLRLSFFRMGG